MTGRLEALALSGKQSAFNAAALLICVAVLHESVLSPFNYPLAFYSKVPEPSPKEALFHLRQPFPFSLTQFSSEIADSYGYNLDTLHMLICVVVHMLFKVMN